MAKLIIMIGISGSGKSTKAKEISERTGALIINRDKLREMLFGYTESNIHNYYNLPDLYLKENQITSFQNYLVERALVKGNDVIIDNTNLKQSYINDFIKSFCKYKIEFELIESDLSEAIKRDNVNIKFINGLACNENEEPYYLFHQWDRTKYAYFIRESFSSTLFCLATIL
mgnify:CR=1 FL=1